MRRRCKNLIGVFFHEAHERAVADDARLDAFHQAGAQFAIGQSAENFDVGKDGDRMMKAADEVLAFGQIDAGFSADRRVDLRQERGGHLYVWNAAHEDRSEKAADVADDAAAESDQQRSAIAPGGDHLPQQSFDAGHGFVLFAGRQKERDGRFSE